MASTGVATVYLEDKDLRELAKTGGVVIPEGACTVYAVRYSDNDEAVLEVAWDDAEGSPYDWATGQPQWMIDRAKGKGNGT